MHHPTDRIAHTTAFVTPVVEHWLVREIAQWVHHMKGRSDDSSHRERTPLPRSYISLRVGWTHEPGGGLFCFQIILVLSCHVLMDAHVSVDIERNVMLQKCVQQVNRFGDGSVMVWAGIHHGGVREIFYLTTHSTHFIYGYMASDI